MKTNNDIIYYELTDGLGKRCVFMNTERSQRIAKVLNDNLNDPNKSLLEKTIGYCSSLINSQMAREEEANDTIKKALDKTEDVKMNKAKMTRAEAILLFLKHMPLADRNHSDGIIDFYIEAGMLEIVEEETVEQKLADKLVHTFAGRTINGHYNLMNILNEAGLKIVEK